MKLKSQSQDEIADITREAFPTMTVRQEVPVDDVIIANGYEPKELEPELRHHVHKMSIDVYATDYASSVAIEYQGEQHYASIGRMSETKNAVRWDQQLDEEKMWTLQRVGVPIVQIAYDEPIDPTILRHLVDKAMEDVQSIQSGMCVCDGCGRRFPRERLSNGLCQRCRTQERIENMREANPDIPDDEKKRRSREERRRRWQEYKQSDAYTERKRQMREARHRAMEEYKQSDAYQRRKEEAKRLRKERRDARKKTE